MPDKLPTREEAHRVTHSYHAVGCIDCRAIHALLDALFDALDHSADSCNKALNEVVAHYKERIAALENYRLALLKHHEAMTEESVNPCGICEASHD